MAHRNGWCEEAIKKEFMEWWNDEKLEDYLARTSSHLKKWEYKHIINYSKQEKGSNAKVFTDCYDENKSRFAMKIPTHNDDMGRLAIYVEYKIHKKIYDLCGDENNRFIKPLWLKKVTFNRGFHAPTIAIGMERFDNTLYEYVCHQKEKEKYGDELFKWKEEIIVELKRLHSEYSFFHRDCHASNIAIIGNDWKFFDLGMARIDDWEPISTGFYRQGIIPALAHDERIFRSSFSSILRVEKDEWEKAEDYKIVKSDPKYWEYNMPVVVNGHPQSENGTFDFVNDSGSIVVELEVEENTKVVNIRCGKLMPGTKYVKAPVKKTLVCHFKRENVLPDVLNPHVYYYMPTLK